jgi:hypothetical protein
MTKILVLASLCFLATSAHGKVTKVPQDYATIQAAVDAAASGDTIMVGPGSWAGATIKKEVTLIGEGNPVISTGPFLSGIRQVGFYLNGISWTPSGTTIRGFTFDGTGNAASGANLAFAIFGRKANSITVTHCTVLGTIQGITNTAGDGWLISHNKIVGQGTEPNGGGIGIVIQTSFFDQTDRAMDNTVTFNEITGVAGSPLGFGTAGIGIFSADNTVVKNNKVVVSTIVSAVDVATGIIVDNFVCGGPCVLNPSNTGAYIVNNDLRGSGLGLYVGDDGTVPNDNTVGLVLRGNFGTNLIGTLSAEIKNRNRFSCLAETCPN